MPTFDPSDLIGRTFLLPPEENGERHRAKVTRKVVEIIDQEDGQRVENINFILDIGNGKAIAAKLMAFYWIQSASNLSDMLSKHWNHPTVYPMILKLLITRGNITLIPREATQEKEKEILNPQKEKLKIEEKQNKIMK